MSSINSEGNARAKVKIIGLGGAGSNILKFLVESKMEGVDFVCVNTDSIALRKSPCQSAVLIGTHSFSGQGAQGMPENGKRAALESIDELNSVLAGTDVVILCAGLGGGTGGGAAPVIANAARELGALAISVVSLPFDFEGRKRLKVAQECLQELTKSSDATIHVPAGDVTLAPGASLLDAFKGLNSRIVEIVSGLANTLAVEGLISIDLDDFKTVFQDSGTSTFSYGRAKGKGRATKAARMARDAIGNQPRVNAAKGMLVNITCDETLTLGEYTEVGNVLAEVLSEDSTMILGTSIIKDGAGSLSVSCYLTGLDRAASTELQFNRSRLLKQLSNIRPDIKLFAETNTDSEELATLIYHLSNIYKSVSGDKLIVRGVNDLPPISLRKPTKRSSTRKYANG